MEDNDTPEPFVGSFFKYLFGLLLIGVVITQTPLGGILSNASADVYISTISLLRTDTAVLTLDDGLLGHWTFDGNYMDLSLSAAEVRDRSSNGNHGNWINHSTTTVAGVMGQAIEFDGVDDYINMGSDTSIDDIFIADDKRASLALWIYINNENGDIITDQYIINKKTSGGWRLYLDDSLDRLVFHFDTYSQPGIWSIDVPFNQWFHVVVTYDNNSESNRPDFYLNGLLKEENQNNARIGVAGFPDSTANLTVGKDANSSSLYFKGKLDDIRIYDRILSADDARRLYQLGAGNKVAATPSPTDNLSSGLVGHWTFDGNNINWGDTTSEIKDASGQNNHGNAISLDTSSAIIGKLGQALEFDGADDNVNLGNLTIIDGATAASICTWVNYGPSAVSADSALVTKWNSGGYLLWVDDVAILSGRSNTISFAVDASASGPGRIEGSTNLVETGVWSHICGTFSGGNFIRLYKNGTLDQENTTSIVASVASQSNNLKIGDSDNASSIKYFDGKMDDVRIYNRALTSAEVAQLYRQGGGVTAKPCGAFTVFDADNNEYRTVQIGNQCWMAENMRVGIRIVDSVSQTNNDTIEKYCYNNNDSNCTTDNPNNPDGGLYQWNEAMQYSTEEGAQGICPAGWHIPTDQEFKDLEIFLGMTPSQANSTGNRGTDQGTQLKPNGSSGFEGNFSGYYQSPVFLNRSTYSVFWSSSESSSSSWYRLLSSGSTQVLRNIVDKTNGLSVRCLRD